MCKHYLEKPVFFPVEKALDIFAMTVDNEDCQGDGKNEDQDVFGLEDFDEETVGNIKKLVKKIESLLI